MESAAAIAARSRNYSEPMIGRAILVVLAALLAVAIHAIRRHARERRERRSLQHITGAYQWWGRR